MAGEKRIYVAKSVSYGGAAIQSATHFSITPRTTKATDPGVAGSGGPAEEVIVDNAIDVQVFGEDYGELLGKVGTAKNTLVCKAIGNGGAERTFTLQDVVFNDPPAADVPVKDAGGTALRTMIAGRVVNWGAGQQISDKLTVA